MVPNQTWRLSFKNFLALRNPHDSVTACFVNDMSLIDISMAYSISMMKNTGVIILPTFINGGFHK